MMGEVSDFTVLLQCLHLGQHFCRIISNLAGAKEFRKKTTALFGEVRETYPGLTEVYL